MGKSNRFGSDHRKFDRRTLRQVRDLKQFGTVDDRNDYTDRYNERHNRDSQDMDYSGPEE